jgi:pilus assembly protein CpaC
MRSFGKKAKRRKFLWQSVSLLLGLLTLAAGVFAQPPCPPQGLPDPPPTIGGFMPQLPPAPQKAPRPATGPESVAAFVDSLSNTDTALEVVVGQGRILTLKEELVGDPKSPPVVAVGDPLVANVVVVNARQFRINGTHIGVTDLSIITGKNKVYTFEIRVVADLNVLRGQLVQIFPDAHLKVAQVRDHIVLEGEARDTRQVGEILKLVRAYLDSIKISQEQRKQARGGAAPAPGPEGPVPPGIGPDGAGVSTGAPKVAVPQIINLIHVPGSQQVLLKVRVAELNRTAFRQIGADMFIANPRSGSVVGTKIGGADVTASGIIPGTSGILTDSANTFFRTSASTTAFGIFEKNFEILLSALRRNTIVRILAEPNLVAMHGHNASFLAGGEFPVPIPQAVGGAGGTSVTVAFKEFGVRLNFVPYILDGDSIRLSVNPEVSTIDFSIGTVLVPGGTPVPGLNTRKVQTTVELKEGQTLAIGGLLYLTLDNKTDRLPVLGDLPVLGPFFSNTTGQRTEKELLVLVTPYLIQSLDHDQVPPGPGDEVQDADDWEFFLHNRIEAHDQKNFRPTTRTYDPPTPAERGIAPPNGANKAALQNYLWLEGQYFRGAHGFSD